jgi:anti-sigma B factor antagonist
VGALMIGQDEGVTVPTGSMGAPNPDALAGAPGEDGVAPGLPTEGAAEVPEVERAEPRTASVVVEQQGAALVLSVSGDVDYVTAPEVRDRVLAVLGEHPALMVINLLGAGFVGSAGLAVLAEAAQLRGSDTAVRVVAARQALRSIQVTGLDGLLRLYPSVADALNTPST